MYHSLQERGRIVVCVFIEREGEVPVLRGEFESEKGAGCY